MQIIEHDIRWQEAWSLLSLDDAMPFFGEMWVPWEAPQLSGGLKEVLSLWKDRSDLFASNPSIVSYECFLWCEANLGAIGLQDLIRWTNSVYIGRRLKRTAEWVWGLVPYIVRQDHALRQQLDPWIVDFFERVISRKEEILSRINDKLEEQFKSPISDWDRTLQVMRDSKREADQTTIQLIVSQNAFTLCWRKNRQHSLVPN